MCLPKREDSLINFQIQALMCLIALSFPTSLVSELPPWTAAPGPCGYRAEAFTCVFIDFVIIRCTIAAVVSQRQPETKRIFQVLFLTFFFPSRRTAGTGLESPSDCVKAVMTLCMYSEGVLSLGCCDWMTCSRVLRNWNILSYLLA